MKYIVLFATLIPFCILAYLQSRPVNSRSTVKSRWAIITSEIEYMGAYFVVALMIPPTMYKDILLYLGYTFMATSFWYMSEKVNNECAFIRTEEIQQEGFGEFQLLMLHTYYTRRPIIARLAATAGGLFFTGLAAVQ